MMYFLKQGYKENLDAVQQPDEEDSEFQPDVYSLANLFVRTSKVDRLIDIGCGSGYKLRAFPDSLEVIGLDSQGVNLEMAKCHRSINTLQVDLNTISSSFLDQDVVSGSVLLCADVVEHLKDPTPTLKAIAVWLGLGALTAFISTPERDCFYTPEHFGPPPNRSHVREWNLSEFGAYLRHCELNYEFLGLTRSHTSDSRPVNILAICSSPQLMKENL